MTPKRFCWFLLLALIIITPLGCRLATDPAAGFGVGRSAEMDRNDACLRECDDQRNLALEAAREEHKRILREVCAPLPWSLEKECRRHEEERYNAVKTAIYEVREKCKIVCRYNEGRGDLGR